MSIFFTLVTDMKLASATDICRTNVSDVSRHVFCLSNAMQLRQLLPQEFTDSSRSDISGWQIVLVRLIR